MWETIIYSIANVLTVLILCIALVQVAKRIQSVTIENRNIMRRNKDEDTSS